MMKIDIWKAVASRWRTLEETVKPLSIVEEKTLEATNLIKREGLLQSPLDYLTSSNDEEEDDFFNI